MEKHQHRTFARRSPKQRPINHQRQFHRRWCVQTPQRHDPHRAARRRFRIRCHHSRSKLCKLRRVGIQGAPHDNHNHNVHLKLIHNHHTAPAAPSRNSLPFVDLMLPQVPLQQHLSDDRLLFLRCSRVTITPDAQNPIGYNVDGQSIPPVTLQITAGVERVDFVTNPPPATSK